ncbi:MAG: hypothetical protein ACPGES_02435 [Coraliomargarita sp.]
MIRLRHLTLLTLTALALACHSALAQSITEPPSDSPTEVDVGVYVIDLLNINGAQKSFRIDVATVFEWSDPRLANDDEAPRRIPIEEVWHPNIQITNLREAANTLPEVVEVSPQGMVTYRQRLRGTFTANFDLREFPDDEQTIAIQFVASGLRQEDLRFMNTTKLVGRSEKFSISDWAVGETQLISSPYKLPQTGEEIPGIQIQLHAERYIGYYIGTVFSSAAIIVCMAWMVFWIDPSAINPRVSISVTSMLTLIAHRFVVQKELPHLPYLTKMDFFLLGSTLIVLIGLIGVVVVIKAHSSGDEAHTKQWNELFKWAYPLAFLVLLVFTL